MKKVTKYIAEDGTEFLDSEPCEKYEAKEYVKSSLLKILQDDQDCDSLDYDSRMSAVDKEEKLRIILENWDHIYTLMEIMYGAKRD